MLSFKGGFKMAYNVSLLELLAAYGKLFSITDQAKL